MGVDAHADFEATTVRRSANLVAAVHPTPDSAIRWLQAQLERLRSVDDLTAVAFTLNTRPRKTLGWRTPAEALDQFLQSVSLSSVATTS